MGKVEVPRCHRAKTLWIKKQNNPKQMNINAINNHRGTSGFHEAKLNSKAVKLRLRYIERAVEETKKLIVLKQGERD